MNLDVAGCTDKRAGNSDNMSYINELDLFQKNFVEKFMQNP